MQSGGGGWARWQFGKRVALGLLPGGIGLYWRGLEREVNGHNLTALLGRTAGAGRDGALVGADAAGGSRATPARRYV